MDASAEERDCESAGLLQAERMVVDDDDDGSECAAMRLRLADLFCGDSCSGTAKGRRYVYVVTIRSSCKKMEKRMSILAVYLTTVIA
jgi:hypothetical protein